MRSEPGLALPPNFAAPPPQPDSAAINGRVGAIKAFFDNGGGLYVGAGADNGDGHGGDVYYEFIQRSSCSPMTLHSASAA